MKVGGENNCNSKGQQGNVDVQIYAQQIILSNY